MKWRINPLGEEEKHFLIVKCCDCGADMALEVMQIVRQNNPEQKPYWSYYIGRFCSNCGPYSRETEYYQDLAEAEADLRNYCLQIIAGI